MVNFLEQEWIIHIFVTGMKIINHTKRNKKQSAQVEGL